MVVDRRHSATDERRAQETADVVEQLRGTCTDEEARRLRQQLILLNVPVATSMAMRYRGRGQSLDDLVQTARLGLVKAVQGYDPHRGQDLLAYAVPTIAGELKRHFRDRGWDIRPPRRVQEMRVDVERASAELEQQLGRSPRVSEIAAQLQAPEEMVIECVASADLYHVNSLDAPIAGAQDVPVSETIGGVDPAMEQIEDVLSVGPLLARLPARDRRILHLRFFEGWTQQQIAEDVGVTQMQISRLLSRALRRLREGLDAA